MYLQYHALSELETSLQVEQRKEVLPAPGVPKAPGVPGAPACTPHPAGAIKWGSTRTYDWSV
eukprot:223153-Pyramimonas_sp.AAC.1